MRTRVARWGNSLAVRIPGGLAADLALTEGAGVSISVEGGRLVLQPENVKPDLLALVAGIRDDNLHGETNWGEPNGAEVW